MQSDLIIKENELLDPKNYPEDQRALVDDFNERIKKCMGLITGLGKEYHTIWFVNTKDLSMSLYRSTGESTARSAVELGLRYNNFDKFIEEYVDRYVVDRTENIINDVLSNVVLDRIKNGNLYTVDYMRMDDDGEISYHQMAFALAGEREDTENFILAYKDIDKSIRKHISDKRFLREQLDIVEALSRDYYNVFKIDLNTGNVVILKLDGYVTKGMDGPSEKEYVYQTLCEQYVKDRVYSEDQPAMYEALGIDMIREKMKTQTEYVSSYRVMDKGEIHYYQFTYIPINPKNPASGILAGFKNVDDVVESAKERENLEILANMDIMTGILNRGSGEQLMSDAISNRSGGMFSILDIDDFKTINDNYGHDVGDKVIRGIADILKSAFRDKDIVFRLGGDEYAVYAFDIQDESTGKNVLDRVFKKIENMNIPELNDRTVTASAGSIIISPDDDHEFGYVYKKADSGVYDSKEQEGCAVTFYRED
ncbi:MAG: GGDEF domain-containing protein [Lachnospiraceae bacterium]|nr:GGDEF domain-containing protein [Lachnospiraceae bacterium]